MPVNATLSPLMEGKASSKAREYGWRGVVKIVGVRPSSATCPAYITIRRSEKCLTREISWVTKTTAKPSRSCRSLIWRISER